MNFYLLRTEDYGYDQFDAFVVCEASEEQARAVAAASDYDNTHKAIWLDPKRSTCERLDPRTASGCILGSFKSG